MTRRADRRQSERANAYTLSSLALQYPDEELVAGRSELAAAAAKLPRGPIAEALGLFFAWFVQGPLLQLLERRMLKWGSPLFHYGALAAIGGHVLGILIPQGATSAIGIDEHTYHLISAAAGTPAGTAALLGLLILIYRRASVRRVGGHDLCVDLAVYALLLFVIALGMLDTLSHNVLAPGNGYNYRHTVAIWFRGVFALQDHAQLLAGVPLVYQIHTLSAWAILALWPFSRLVHAWSIPYQYIGRPCILYRRRYRAAR